MHISGKGNFRRELKQPYTVYKGKRKDKPDNFRELKDYVIAKYKPITKDGLEADDTISIEATNYLNNNQLYMLITIDKDLKTNLSNNIYNLPGKVIVFTDKQNIIKSKQDKIQSFLNKDIKVYDSLELKLLLIFLAKDYQCNTVLFEAGSILNAKLLEKRLINELIIYKSPKILGQDGISMFNINNITEQQLAMDFNSSLVNNLNYFKLHGAQAIDNDVKLTYRL